MAAPRGGPAAAALASIFVAPGLRLRLVGGGGAGAAAGAADSTGDASPPPVAASPGEEGAGSPPARPRADLEREYWASRLGPGNLLQVDALFSAFAAVQALLMASRATCATGRAAAGLLLATCAGQAAGLALAPRAYSAARTRIVVAARLAHCGAAALALLAVQAQLAGTDGPKQLGVPPSPSDVAAVATALACTGAARLALLPLGLVLPFRLAAPLQLLDYAVTRVVGSGALVRAAAVLQTGGPALRFAYDLVDGAFHVCTVLLFPGAYELVPTCPVTASRRLAVFLQLAGGCLLPLYAAYAAELGGKVVFLAHWAHAQGAVLRIARGGRGGLGGSTPGTSSAGSGGSAPCVATEPPSSGDRAGADGERSSGGAGGRNGDGGSSRSGGSWPSVPGPAAERPVVLLTARCPVALATSDPAPGRPVIVPATHCAWAVLLMAGAWGVASQLPAQLGGAW